LQQSTGLDFDALQLRLHPASSRVAMLSAAQPASFVAFDVLAIDGRDVTSVAQAERRALLEAMLASPEPPLYVTPVTSKRAQAEQWLTQFEGAGLDGVIAKTCRSPLCAGQARDAEGQARAHRRLRGRRLSLVQGQRRRGRLAPARPVRLTKATFITWA
jgi:ATP-dependent DNA ligase